MLRRSWNLLRNGQWFCCTRLSKLHTSHCPVLCSRFDKDLPYPNLPTPITKALKPNIDILHDELQKSKNMDRLLELIDMHLDVMNSKHVVTCFQRIHSFVKEDTRMAESLLENSTFQSMCSRLMKVIRFFEPQEVLTAYKTLSELKIANNTYVMQCVLKMLGAHLNNMNLGQLVFLNFLLHRQRHNSLVDGLKLAIPLVLQVQIDHQLDSDNMTEVVNCFQLSVRARLKASTIEKIMNVIIQKASIISVENAVTVIFALLNLETPVDGYKELRNSAFEIVCQNIADIKERKILSLLGTCRSQNFYHSKFFFAVVDHMVTKRWDLELTYSVISSFARLDFAPNKLLDYFAELICIERVRFRLDKVYSPLSCIEFLTHTSYQPKYVDEAARILYADEERLLQWAEISPYLLVKFLSCLAQIGHFPQPYLSKALDEDFLYEAWSHSRKQGRSNEFERNILQLSWAFEVFDETDNFTIPSSLLHKFINHVFQHNVNRDYPLAKFIENGLGGPQFLESGIFTQNGHVIDHVVAMRSGNYPVALRKCDSDIEESKNVHSLTFIEDFVLPEDVKIITILVCQEQHYCRDPEILKGYMDLKVRNLAKKNYSTLVINYALWRDLPDREKIPYLMREIKNAVQDDCLFKTNFS